MEAWDLLDILNRGNDAVLGNNWSRWRNPVISLPLVMGGKGFPQEVDEIWNWVRILLPPKAERRIFETVRWSLDLSDSESSASEADVDRLLLGTRANLKVFLPRFMEQHNPFIRHIVRRSRKYFEETDLETE